ncbi:MAG: methylated-DNA--[protein]-cysteine S-methyltransferase [Cyanobacteria bacterium P01_F01_bin.53]
MTSNNVTYYTWIESPVGDLLLTSNGQSLTGLYLKGQKHFPEMEDSWKNTTDLEIFTQVQAQLTEYFTHKRETFDIPLAPQGTPFQKEVWLSLHQIPFGETSSYGTLAQQLGKPGGARAVGAANGRNPISIIVPCHRVIASNGKMTGYAGGIDRKQWLLRHEQKVSSSAPQKAQNSAQENAQISLIF